MPVKDVFQQFVLCQFSSSNSPRLTVDAILDRSLPPTLPLAMRQHWRVEIELACALLALRGYLVADHRNGCSAYRIGDAHRPTPVPQTPNALLTPRFARLALPLTAAIVMNACSLLPSNTSPSTNTAATSYWGDNEAPRPAPVMRTYHDEGITAPPLASRIEQFPRNGGTAVYRMCDDDCPGPTPKRPAMNVAMAPTATTTPIQTPAPALLPPSPAAKEASNNPRMADTNALMKKQLVEALATAFPGTTVVAKSKVKEVEPRQVAAIPDETFAAPATTKQIAKITTPATLSKAPTVAPAVTEPIVTATPAAPSIRYVDPHIDTNATVTSAERARIDRLMSEARPTGVTTLPPVTVTPATGSTAEPRMEIRETATTQVLATAATSSSITPQTTAADPADLLSAWAEAWSSRNIEKYFAFYDQSFIAYETPRTAEFMAGRRRIMESQRNIEVKVDPIAVDIRGDYATIRFWQDYRGPRFKSRVMKTLHLVRADAGGDWKIRRERLVHSELTGERS